MVQGERPILDATQEILVAAKQVQAGTQQIAVVAQEASAASEQAATAARQQFRAAEDLAAAVEEIASLASCREPEPRHSDLLSGKTWPILVPDHNVEDRG